MLRTAGRTICNIQKQELANHREQVAKQPSAGFQRAYNWCRWSRRDGECVPADSLHPRGPEGLTKALGPDRALVGTRSSRLLRVEGRGRWCGSLLAAFCPAFPRPHEQIWAAEFRFDELRASR